MIPRSFITTTENRACIRGFGLQISSNDSSQKSELGGFLLSDGNSLTKRYAFSGQIRQCGSPDVSLQKHALKIPASTDKAAFASRVSRGARADDHALSRPQARVRKRASRSRLGEDVESSRAPRAAEERVGPTAIVSLFAPCMTLQFIGAILRLKCLDAFRMFLCLPYSDTTAVECFLAPSMFLKFPWFL